MTKLEQAARELVKQWRESAEEWRRKANSAREMPALEAVGLARHQELYQCADMLQRAISEQSAPADPVAWMYTLHQELGQTRSMLSEERDPDNFGIRGKDYDPTYYVTETPLYAAKPSAGIPREVTDEMRAAGLRAIEEWDEGYTIGMAEAVYLAMRDAAHTENTGEPGERK